MALYWRHCADGKVVAELGAGWCAMGQKLPAGRTLSVVSRSGGQGAPARKSELSPTAVLPGQRTATAGQTHVGAHARRGSTRAAPSSRTGLGSPGWPLGEDDFANAGPDCYWKIAN